MGVYLIRCLPTAKVYVGKSQHIPRRWAKHCAALIKGVHTNPYLQRAWNKYGADAFEFHVLECVETVELLGSSELKYVLEFRALDSAYGFNPNEVTADGGFQVSEETRQKMSASGKARYALNPKVCTPEEKERLRELNKNRGPVSPETKARMSAASKGKPKSPEHRAKLGAKKGHAVSEKTRALIGAAHKGLKHSDEAKAKMSATRTGKVFSEETRIKMSETHKQRQTYPEVHAQLQRAQAAHWPKSKLEE